MNEDVPMSLDLTEHVPEVIHGIRYSDDNIKPHQIPSLGLIHI
jgi:hypothetical protein